MSQPYPSWTEHVQHVAKVADCHLCTPQQEVKEEPQALPLPKSLFDYSWQSDEERNRFTTVTVYAHGLDFETTDHEGGSEEGFELSWAEIFQLGKEYIR